MKEHIAICLLYRMRHQLVANNAAVNIEILQVCLAARKSRQTYPSPESHARRFALDEYRVLDKGWAAHESNASSPFGFGSRWKQFVDSALIVIQRKHHIEAAQRHSLEHFIDAREFGFFGFQKLTPSRRVKKQVANLYSRPCWMRGGRQPGLHLLPLGLDTPRGFLVTALPRSRSHTQTRDRADAC